MKKIHVFTPYYLAEDFDRQNELDLCLAKNLAVDAIDRIFLLVDDGHVPPVDDPRITVIAIDGRPSYAGWLDLTAQHSAGAISVLANSDIYLDSTITELNAIFAASPQALVAVSRYEIAGDTVTLHKNPHWSQDVWAIDGDVPVSADIRRNMQIPLGVPRCDNKIGYVFSVYGYDIFNPCHFVRTYHLHETQLRSYDTHLDQRIMGGSAWLYPSETLTTPARMVFDVWTLKPGPVERVKMNDTILVKQKMGLGSPPRRKPADCIVAYDQNWQFPAITEQHAYNRLCERLDTTGAEGRVIYFAFPWATLIDNLMHNKKNPGKTAFLRQKLYSFAARLGGAETVITTCQHIHMLRFQSLFRDLGVTDIFWSHAVEGQTALPEFPGIRIHPFPLYPVQAKEQAGGAPVPKKHLYSFVGAKANQYYLTDSRNIIIEDLAKDRSGLIIGNETWHYNKVVYDHQVRGIATKEEALVDAGSSQNFQKVLGESVFSLCPSGTGPNSIRLWESIGLGAIPVIMADTLALPGNPALWEAAAVFCKEDRASILAVPARLKAIHADGAELKRKRHAMAQIWDLYGIDSFVTDIERLMLEKIQAARLTPRAAPSTAPVRAAGTPLPAAFTPAYPAPAGFAGRSLNAVTTEILLAPDRIAPQLRARRPEIEHLLRSATAAQQTLFARALETRGLKTVWEN